MVSSHPGIRVLFCIWLHYYKNLWITCHDLVCPFEGCGNSVVLDGAWKIFRQRVCCFRLPDRPSSVPHLMRRDLCGSYTLPNSNVCCEHRAMGAAPLPTPRVRLGDCKTRRKPQPNRGHMGYFGGRFLHCGMFLFFWEILGSESLAMVADYVQELLQALPSLKSLGYDDACHLAEVLRRRPNPAMRALSLWIDLFHIRGHVRQQCFLQHHPVLHLLAAAPVYVLIDNENQRDALVRTLAADGKVRRRAAFSSIAQLPTSHPPMRLVSAADVTAVGVARAIVEFMRTALPVHAKLRAPDGSETVVTFSQDHRRTHFIRMLNVAEGRLWQKTQIQGHRFPKHSSFVSWTDDASPPTEHLIARPTHLIETLRTHALPLRAGFVPTWNTSIAEQGWPFFNAHKHTIRHLDSEGAFLFLHRLGHLRNCHIREDLQRARDR